MVSKETSYMTERQAAAFTSLSVHKFRQDRFHCRGIPYVKLGRAVRYSVDDLRAYMAAHRITPDNESD